MTLKNVTSKIGSKVRDVQRTLNHNKNTVLGLAQLKKNLRILEWSRVFKEALEWTILLVWLAFKAYCNTKPNSKVKHADFKALVIVGSLEPMDIWKLVNLTYYHSQKKGFRVQNS